MPLVSYRAHLSARVEAKPGRRSSATIAYRHGTGAADAASVTFAVEMFCNMVFIVWFRGGR
jgi:hypothetical protein